MKRIFRAISVLVVAGSLLAAESEPVTIPLGGPRKAIAEISETVEQVEVTIQMLAVRAFDRTTNEQISRAKANGYAKVALARHLSTNSKSVKLSLAMATVESTSTEGRYYRLTLRMPRKGIQITESGTAKGAASSRQPKDPAVAPTSPSTVFTAKADYEMTLGLLTDRLIERIPACLKNDTDEEREAFFRQIAELEEQGDHSYEALTDEIKKEKLLLSNEVEELVKQIEMKRAELFGSLKRAVIDVTGSIAE